ncbi:type II secretion system F family protein [uncultured Psychroserpens sp.]|uniref:type II secretion system F family protein n=1 Tax=uncultured Psychroserpens sp. TaxID=255436 RepID=UPI00261D1531|nr:type II secretion system F family protein [uncultured Psychroserpens sp.]
MMGFQLENIKKTDNIHINNNEYTSILDKEIIVLKKPFSNKTKEDFYTEISILLKAGINIKDAIQLIKNSTKNKKAQSILQVILDNIIRGKSLSESIKAQKDFSNYEYYSLKIGEETGSTGKITMQLGEFYFRKNEQRKQLINAITYPSIILTTAILVVVFMLQFVVPMFEDIFKQQNVELPTITKFVVNTSAFLKSYSLLILFSLLLLIILSRLIDKKGWYKQTKAALISKIPFIGNFVKTVYLSQFTQAIALLSASKVPIVNSISLVKEMIAFHPLTCALKKVENQLLNGNTLSESLSEHKLFDAKMIALVKVAEETNKTEDMFERLNSQYNNKVLQHSKMLSAIMEPIIIMFVGLFVGFILIALYLPMFKLSSILG